MLTPSRSRCSTTVSIGMSVSTQKLPLPGTVLVKVGDRVRVQETRPLSKLKRWRIIEVLERAR